MMPSRRLFYLADVHTALDKWKATTLRGTYKHFTEMYYELLTILGYQISGSGESGACGHDGESWAVRLDAHGF